MEMDDGYNTLVLDFLFRVKDPCTDPILCNKAPVWDPATPIDLYFEWGQEVSTSHGNAAAVTISTVVFILSVLITTSISLPFFSISALLNRFLPQCLHTIRTREILP